MERNTDFNRKSPEERKSGNSQTWLGLENNWAREMAFHQNFPALVQLHFDPIYVSLLTTTITRQGFKISLCMLVN